MTDAALTRLERDTTTQSADAIVRLMLTISKIKGGRRG